MLNNVKTITRKQKIVPYGTLWVSLFLMSAILGGAGFGYIVLLFAKGSNIVTSTLAGYSWGLSFSLCGTIFLLAAALAAGSLKKHKIQVWLFATLLFLISFLPICMYSAYCIISIMSLPYVFDVSAAFLPIGFYLLWFVGLFPPIINLCGTRSLIRRAKRIASGNEEPSSLEDLDNLVNECLYLNQVLLAEKLSSLLVDYAERRH